MGEKKMKLAYLLVILVLASVCVSFAEAAGYSDDQEQYSKRRDQPKKRYKLHARKYKRRDLQPLEENSPCSCEQSCSTCSTSGTSSSTEGENTSGIENTVDCECHISMKFKAKVQKHEFEESRYEIYEQAREMRQRWKSYDNDYICEKDNVDYPATYNQMCPIWDQNTQKSIFTKQIIKFQLDKPLKMVFHFTQSDVKVWGLWVNGLLVDAKQDYVPHSYGYGAGEDESASSAGRYYPPQPTHLQFQAVFPKGKHRLVVYSSSNYFWAYDGPKDTYSYPNIYDTKIRLGNPINAKITQLSETKFRNALCNIDCEDTESDHVYPCYEYAPAAAKAEMETGYPKEAYGQHAKMPAVSKLHYSSLFTTFKADTRISGAVHKKSIWNYCVARNYAVIDFHRLSHTLTNLKEQSLHHEKEGYGKHRRGYGGYGYKGHGRSQSRPRPSHKGGYPRSYPAEEGSGRP